ncbi:type IV secretory system conjugative DNA transfer family protein [Streptomyces rugosispiralis]|uniref:TraM recognition domain-containing protein n=1 Tax=Streptomyces rugosispiralis TaxID=2967341 RepID=A0ABT1VBA8_9ACTN|nr:TraM recognition domain-containing protein [Streptomyces rugosispiralis]MCQ8194678.1 TraM recognition domain-containing protein [Streptomyces rugosispiralis]
MNDNSKASTLTHSTTLPADTNSSASSAAGESAEQPGTWEPVQGDALKSVLFSTPHLLARPGIRLTALTVPATFLAAETTTNDTSPGDVLSTIFGVLADGGAALFESQPLLTVAMGLGLVGAGYMKVRGDFDFAADEDGFAAKRQLRKHLGHAQLVKKRKTLRPSLADVPARKVPTSAVGVYLGQDRKTKLHLYMSIEESSLMLAPMGAGKTAKIANWIIDAEGAVLATSTKFDIVEWTERLRARVGRILIWNPQGIAGRSSNIAWDPTIGCSDRDLGVERSMRRAQYLLEGSDATKGVENRTFWQTASYSVLKAFLWAADAEGLSLLDVARWTKSVRNTEAISIFEKYEHPDPFNPSRPVAPRGWKEDLEQVQKVEGKPTTSENVFGTLSKTFMFLDAPRVQQIVAAAHDPGTPQFDIDAYLTSHDTLYLLGREDGMGSIGPLFTCLTGEIYEAARVMAPMNRGGRLDPPWTMVLDEAALICSVPLPLWTADSRGLGINIHACFQSPAQIYERWGKFGYQTIWDNCVKLVLGGLSNKEHLQDLSELCGKHKEKKESRSRTPGPDGTMKESVSWTKVEVDTMTASEIMNLEPGELLILRKHLGGPVLAHFTPVWDRKDIKTAEKADKKAAKAERKARKRKASVAATVPAPPVREAPADLWGPPQPADPWAPTGPDISPWTADPAASTWSPAPLPGQRDAQVVRGEVVPPRPEQPPVVPQKPDFEPTGHLEQVPPQPESAADKPADRTAPIPLRKTGTDGNADPGTDDGWGDDDETGF